MTRRSMERTQSRRETEQRDMTSIQEIKSVNVENYE